MATRTIFLQISPAQQALFYLLALAAVAACAHGLLRRVRLWRQGRPIPPIRDWPRRARVVADHVLGHRRVVQRRYAGLLHLGIFFGFGVLFVGTCIVAAEHYGAWLFGPHWLYKGAFYLATKTILDLFGLALLAGTSMALVRRYGSRPRSLGHEWRDGAFLLLLLAATATGFLLEGARIALTAVPPGIAAFSPVGAAVAGGLALTGPVAPAAYLAAWWVHVVLVLAVIAVLPYGRWLHLFLAPLSIGLQPGRPMGVLEPVILEEVEKTGRIGLGRTSDFDRWSLLSLDACMECGRCTDACPAKAVGKELDPKGIVLDLRRLMQAGAGEPEPSTDVITDESLWACTNCQACVRECPVLIRHVDLIDGIRRFRVAEGRLAGSAAVMLRQLASRENPWGLPGSQRLDWAHALDVPVWSGRARLEVLFWVGCAGAFEPRAQQTSRAIVRLLRAAGVEFAVLGPRERCSGDPARRVGDEFLFQQLAEQNIAALQEANPPLVLTQCPHCLHTLGSEYPQFGGTFRVVHHTQFLAWLVDEGRLRLPRDRMPVWEEERRRTGDLPPSSVNPRLGLRPSVTYHDPCFLARVHGETRAPRVLLVGSASELREVERRECRTFCCGAGGGRMWMEEPPGQRPGLRRAADLLATGAQTVAVACPYCKIMLGDAAAQLAGDSAPAVRDVAEVLADALPEPVPPPPR